MGDEVAVSFDERILDDSGSGEMPLSPLHWMACRYSVTDDEAAISFDEYCLDYPSPGETLLGPLHYMICLHSMIRSWAAISTERDFSEVECCRDLPFRSPEQMAHLQFTICNDAAMWSNEYFLDGPIFRSSHIALFIKQTISILKIGRVALHQQFDPLHLENGLGIYTNKPRHSANKYMINRRSEVDAFKSRTPKALDHSICRERKLNLSAITLAIRSRTLCWAERPFRVVRVMSPILACGIGQSLCDQHDAVALN